MKRLISIASMLIFMACTAQSQEPFYDFPFIGWSQTMESQVGDFTGNFPSEIFELRIEEDTIIDAQQFFRVEANDGRFSLI